MAIHHDSHAYGNLEKLRADVGEDELLSEIAEINGEEEIVYPSEHFSPKATLECGQLFRFKEYGEGYLVFSRGQACYIFTRGGNTVIRSTDQDYFYNYFDLDRDYSLIYAKAASYGIPAISRAAEFGKGIRILKQDGEEAIYSFIISQNNRIPRIKAIIERVCSAFGEEKEFMGEKYFAFPSSSALAQKDAAFYKAAGAGYRDEFLSATAKRIEKEGISNLYGLSTAELKKELLTYKGVGPKVADCAALFGFGRTDSFPVDTWMEKVYKDDFGGKETDRKKITAYFEDIFGDYSGYMQQYLFYAKREGALK